MSLFATTDRYNRWELDAGRGFICHYSVGKRVLIFLDWQYESVGRIRSAPTVSDGAVYVGTDDHAIHAIDATTGRLEWQYDTHNVV